MTSPEPPATATPAVNADTTASTDVLEQAFAADSLVLLRNTAAAHAAALASVATGDDHHRLPGHRPRDRSRRPRPAGTSPQPPSQLGGRGIWLVRQFTHALDIQSGRDETRITATINLHEQPTARQSPPPSS